MHIKKLFGFPLFSYQKKNRVNHGRTTFYTCAITTCCLYKLGYLYLKKFFHFEKIKINVRREFEIDTFDIVLLERKKKRIERQRIFGAPN